MGSGSQTRVLYKGRIPLGLCPYSGRTGTRFYAPNSDAHLHSKHFSDRALTPSQNQPFLILSVLLGWAVHHPHPPVVLTGVISTNDRIGAMLSHAQPDWGSGPRRWEGAGR